MRFYDEQWRTNELTDLYAEFFINDWKLAKFENWFKEVVKEFDPTYKIYNIRFVNYDGPRNFIRFYEVVSSFKGKNNRVELRLKVMHVGPRICVSFRGPRETVVTIPPGLVSYMYHGLFKVVADKIKSMGSDVETRGQADQRTYRIPYNGQEEYELEYEAISPFETVDGFVYSWTNGVSSKGDY